MDRREFSKQIMMAGMGLGVVAGMDRPLKADTAPGDFYEEPAQRLPIRRFDVVVAGGGTAGVVAAVAAARQGAKTALVEVKGYPGGTVTEGGTAPHSFYNLWKAFPGVEKRQVVRGIPQENIDRLLAVGGTTGHAEMSNGYNYDSVCTAIDTEMYKLVTFEMLVEAGVFVCVNTLLVAGMMITSDHRAHMSTRNTFSCMGQGQAAGTAAALCAQQNCGTRDLPYAKLRAALVRSGVYLES
jgi:hypothetical protein